MNVVAAVGLGLAYPDRVAQISIQPEQDDLVSTSSEATDVAEYLGADTFLVFDARAVEQITARVVGDMAL